MLKHHRHYKNAKLIGLLAQIRKPGRYGERKYRGMKGVNVLTNAARRFNHKAVKSELKRAHKTNNNKFTPKFTDPKLGFSYGLNPYTDWALAQLKAPPTHYYLFLGLDWYSISELGKPEKWFPYIKNPFHDQSYKNKYWLHIWAWILKKYRMDSNGKLIWEKITSEMATEFIQNDGGAFIFHNLIPYLRPAGEKSAGTRWYDVEFKKPAVKKDVIEDLRLLRKLADNRIVAFCTNKDKSQKCLVETGYEKCFSWGAHPSYPSFSPKHFKNKMENKLWFQGKKYFQ